ncbi:MAG: putative STE/STE7/MKK protein kinase, partial [Streblomastix strix]
MELQIDFVNEPPIMLGEGAFGTTYLMKTRGGELYAVKTLRSIEEKYVRKAKQEAEKMMKLQSKFVADCKGYFIKNQHVNIVMEYCPFDNLSKLISVCHENGEQLSDELFWRLASEIGRALDYIHKQNAVHRDIKPDNILLTEGQHFKLVDFGNALIMEDGNKSAMSFAGTQPFLCPEMIKSERYGVEADLWSFGVTLYFVGEQRLPFPADNSKLLFEEIQNEPPAPFEMIQDPQKQELILGLLNK